MSEDRHLSQLVLEAARHGGGKKLTTHSHLRPSVFTLQDIVQQSENFAAQLHRLGIGCGDVVALQLPAWGEWLIAALGSLRAGAVILPLTTNLGWHDLAYMLTDAAAAVYIGPDQWRGTNSRDILTKAEPLPHLRHRLFVGASAHEGELDWAQMTSPPPLCSAPIVLPTADYPAMLVYTSGTTSAPKAVQHSSRTLWAELLSQQNMRMVADAEVILSPWPPGHVAGALSMLRFLFGRSDLFLMDEWSAQDAAQLVHRHKVTTMSTTPFHLNGLLDAADESGADLSSLQNLLSGAAPVPPSLISRCEERGLHPYRCYGSSEMPTVSMGRPTDPLDKRLTTEGRLMPDVEISFRDDNGQEASEGEIALRGPDLFIGYKDPAAQAAAFTPDGWFLSGDVGKLDEDGYLIITDRKKDIIIRGGENISSREVEDILRLHPDIADVAVVAAPDVRMGEIVCAFLITRSGAQIPLDDIRAHLMAHGLAKHKRPEFLYFQQDFPRSATGKILKHELRASLKPLPDAQPNRKGA